MELQAMLIGVAIVVISAILLYLISVCSMTEKTFEEVIEEQRKRNELSAPPTKSKTDKEKLKKRFRKGKGVKADESPKMETCSESEQEKTEKMVEYDLEPEIITPVEKVNVEPVKGKKKKSGKSILLNKAEVPIVSQKAETQELFHAEKVVPRVKDELELKHEREIILKKAEEMERERMPKEKKKKDLKKLEEMVMKKEEITVKQDAPQLKAEGKKAKKSKLDETDGTGMRNAQLISTLKVAHLNEGEIQSLIEVLLNKQGASAAQLEWTKKTKSGDPVAVLKKQLEDKEHTLQDEQKSAQNSQARLKEMKVEMQSERQKFTESHKKSQDKLAAQVLEIQALHNRMQKTHEAHRSEKEQYTYQLEQMQSKINGNSNANNSAAIIQNLTEENARLKETVAQHSRSGGMELKIVKDELAKNVALLNKSNNSIKEKDTKLNHYEDKVRSLEREQRDSEAVLSKQLKAVSDAHMKAEKTNEELSKNLDNVKQKAKDSETELNNAISKINDLIKKEDTVSELSENLKALKEENVMLLSELKTTKERTAGEGQEAPVEKSEVKVDAAEKDRENEYNKIVKKKKVPTATLR